MTTPHPGVSTVGRPRIKLGGKVCQICANIVTKLIESGESKFIGQQLELPPPLIIKAIIPKKMCEDCVRRLQKCTTEKCEYKVFGGKCIKCSSSSSTRRSLEVELLSVRRGSNVGDDGDSASGVGSSANDVGANDPLMGYIFVF